MLPSCRSMTRLSTKNQPICCVVNTFASSNLTQSLSSTYQCHEREERRSYEHRIREVEHGSFTPLVFSATGGMGKTAQTTYKKLVLMLAESGI